MKNNKIIIDQDKYKELTRALQQELARPTQPEPDPHAGQKVVEVFTATELTTKEKNTLRRLLEKKYGQNFFIYQQVKPQLLGGLRIKIGDDVFDDTLSNRLRQLKIVLS